MNAKFASRLTHAPRFTSETGRRGVLAGIASGTAALLSHGPSSAKKRKKKKCTHCPQRACCSCRTVLQGPATKCITFEGIADLNAAQDLCTDFCGQDLLFKFNFQIPGLANVCRADFDCDVKQCPIKV